MTEAQAAPEPEFENIEKALRALVRLLAQQTARETFARSSFPPADSSVSGGRPTWCIETSDGGA